MGEKPTLTFDELAGLEMAAGLAIAWYKKGPRPRGRWARAEIAKLTGLISKLNALMDPYQRRDNEDGEIPDNGDDAFALKYVKGSAP